MDIPPIKLSASGVIGVEFNGSDDQCEDFKIEVTDEGGGAFVIIACDKGLRLEADELVALGKWAKKSCEELDAFHTKQHNQLPRV